MFGRSLQRQVYFEGAGGGNQSPRSPTGGMTVGPCDGYTAWAIVDLSLLLDGLGMDNPTCSSCATGIMTSALNPHFSGRRKKFPPGQRTLPRQPGSTAGNTSEQQRPLR